MCSTNINYNNVTYDAIVKSLRNSTETKWNKEFLQHKLYNGETKAQTSLKLRRFDKFENVKSDNR